MNSATTLSGATPAPIRAQRLLGLYLPLFLTAAIEAFDGLSQVPALFGDISEIPGPGLGGAGAGRLHYAIFALGSLILMKLAERHARAALAFGIGVFLHGF
jgi:hypothetical protein